MIYDVAIIGTGPAGLSAALNMKIHQKNFIWLGSRNMSDKISKAEKISNYPGFYEVTGEELNEAFKNQAKQMGLVIEEHMVNSIMQFSGHFALMAGSEFYEAKSVILTTGIAMRSTLARETEMLGKGISYCATCDGGLYRDKTIAVISNNARFEHEVKYLAEIAEKVYFFPQYPGAAEIAENVEIRKEKPVEVTGGGRVDGLLLADQSRLDLDGVFILRDSISLTSLLQGLELEDNHIAVNRQMETNIPGVFAAGDCTGRPYQYTKAVGEGNVAAHSVIEYLAKLEDV